LGATELGLELRHSPAELALLLLQRVDVAMALFHRHPLGHLVGRGRRRAKGAMKEETDWSGMKTLTVKRHHRLRAVSLMSWLSKLELRAHEQSHNACHAMSHPNVTNVTVCHTVCECETIHDTHTNTQQQQQQTTSFALLLDVIPPLQLLVAISGVMVSLSSSGLLLIVSLSLLLTQSSTQSLSVEYELFGDSACNDIIISYGSSSLTVVPSPTSW
jgi:hypothetical protein